MYFDDMALGMQVELKPAVIKKEKMLEFARDYDNIPLHTDEEYANDLLTGTATLTNLKKRNPKNGLAEVSITVTNQKGELVLTNVTEAVVKCKPLSSQTQ